MVRQNQLKIPYWFLDGFVGILALMIYNFLLFLSKMIGVKGIMADMEDAMGYFCLKTFQDFGFNMSMSIIGLIGIFIFAFLLGLGIGKLVRKQKRYRI